MRAVEEITVWKVHYRQPNHQYLLDGDRVVAYRQWGKGKPLPSASRMRLDMRGRKFRDIDIKVFGTLAVQRSDIIKITGSRGDVYEIDREHGTCTCAGFRFRGTCKHLKQAA